MNMFRPSTPTEPIPQAAWRGSSPVVSVDGEPLFADDLMASIVPETPSSMPPQPLQQPRLLGTPQKQDWQMQSDSLPSTASYSVEAQPALLVPKQHSFYTQRVSNGGVDDSGVETAQETHAQGDLGMLSDLEVPSTCAMLKQNKLVHEMLALEPLGKSGEEACSNLSLKQGLLLRDPHDSGDTCRESPHTLINLLQQLVGRADPGSIRHATSVVRGALEQKHPPLPAPQQPVREGDQQPSATSSDFSTASGMAKQVVDEVRRKVEMGDECCAAHTQGVVC